VHRGDKHGAERLEKKDPEDGKTSGSGTFGFGILPRGDGDGDLRNDARYETSEDQGSSPHFIDKVGSDSGKDKVRGDKGEVIPTVLRAGVR
jgi:hypothetical protein